MIIPAPTILIPQQTDIQAQIASMPVSAGIYSLAVSGGEPHVSWSANLPRRLKRLLLPRAAEGPTARSRLAERVVALECWPTGSKLETSLLLYEVVRGLFPKDYVRRLRLRMPWFVAAVDEREFARLTVVNRIVKDSSLVLGPFATRELAQYYAEAVLGLFQMRRCTERLEPSPEHPGCIYGEMNQCLRPCQAVVSPAGYAAESARVADFVKTNGRSTLHELSSLRNRASEAMQFEEALQIHKRMERVQEAIAARNEPAALTEHLNGIALTRSTQTRQFLLWPMWKAKWLNPVVLDLSTDEPQPKSLDSELREKLTPSLNPQTHDGNQLEHLALLLRWYRSSLRDGEWFPFRTPAELNYRKLVREISQLVKTA